MEDADLIYNGVLLNYRPTLDAKPVPRSRIVLDNGSTTVCADGLRCVSQS